MGVPTTQELVDALRGLVRVLEAVRYTAGLGKHQMERLNAAKALLDRASLPTPSTETGGHDGR